jgi:general secretion pathway protein J
MTSAASRGASHFKTGATGRGKRNSRQRGITLIELLIAVTLVSLLAVGMLFAMRSGFTAYERIQAKMQGSRRVASVQRILTEQISSIIPATVECAQEGAPSGVKMPFFQGEQQTLRFVSSFSMSEAARGNARVVEYQVIPGDRGRGVRLIVNEYVFTASPPGPVPCLGIAPDPLTGALLPRFAPVVARPSSFVLADRLASCAFRYRRLLPNGVDAEWLPRWSGDTLPTAVAVDMQPLAPDPSRPPVLGVTVPVFVTKQVLGKYADYE